MKAFCSIILLCCISANLLAAPPKAPAGKVWILNPLMSDEFDAEGADPDVFNVYSRDRSWGRTAAFDPKALRAEQDPDNANNYFLTLNPLWYYDDEVFYHQGNDRTYTFAGAALDTKHLQTYGYYEVRIRPSDFPFGSGVFMNDRGNPATECLENYSTELDLIENMGYTGPQAGEIGNKGGFFNYVQHVNSHTKALKYVDAQGNCVQYDGWDAWDSRGAAHYDLEDPHAFFTVGMWWEDGQTAHFYNNDKKFNSLTPARDFDIPMALILSMETYITAGNEENNAGNPKPQEWMWEEEFRTRDQRAVKYDWLRTWQLVDIDAQVYNEQTDNVGTYEVPTAAYLGENLNATIIYSATGDKTLKVSLVSPTNETIADTSYSVSQGVASLSVSFPISSTLAENSNYQLKYSIEDDDRVESSGAATIAIGPKPLTKMLFVESVPTSLQPAATIDLALHYEVDTTCKIVVEVHQPDGEGIAWKSKVVQMGNGIANFDLDLSSPLDYGSDYYFRIYMFRNGMNWQDPQAVSLGNIYFDVEDPLQASLSINSVDEIATTDENINITFSYTSDYDGRLKLELLDGNKNTLYSEDRGERYGSRTVSRAIKVTNGLDSGDNYMIVATYRAENNEETSTDTLKNITITGRNTTAINLAKAYNNDVILSPNPTTRKVNIKLINNKKIENLEIYTITGKEVSHPMQDINSRDFDLDVSSYENGTYILRITSENQLYTKKLIKL